MVFEHQHDEFKYFPAKLKLKKNLRINFIIFIHFFKPIINVGNF